MLTKNKNRCYVSSNKNSVVLIFVKNVKQPVQETLDDIKITVRT